MKTEIKPKKLGDEPVVLIVDDEPAVLSSLRRLFRGKQYEIITESNPAEALKRIDSEQIDLIISDMRMPEINGTEILRHAADRQPGSVRILLTGYADLEDAIEAVNSGGIFRYLTKPWDNKAIVEAVESGLYVKELESSNEKLAGELSKQNAALKDLTATLAGRVRSRNRDFESNLSALKSVSESLGSDLDTVTRMLVGLIEGRLTGLSGSALRIGACARLLAEAADCTPELSQQIYEAALFHELGMLELESSLVDRPEAQLENDDQKRFRKNALLAACMLGQTGRYRVAAQIIRHRYEHFDGCGEPDQLSRIGIPLGSRILAVACAYENLRNGKMLGEVQDAQQAIEWIKKRSGRNFDPQVVEYLGERVNEIHAQQELRAGQEGRSVSLDALKPDMVLAGDLTSNAGLPLCLAGRMLTAEDLARLREYQTITGTKLSALVQDP